ncbi:unnamed protein product, partial [Heterosigma akashiwo]
QHHRQRVYCTSKLSVVQQKAGVPLAVQQPRHRPRRVGHGPRHRPARAPCSVPRAGHPRLRGAVRR